MGSSIDGLISKGSARWPNNKAIVEAKTKRSITYSQLNKRVEALAGRLSQEKLKKGERVGILSRNSITFASFYFAISRAGCVAVPFNYTLDHLEIVRQAKDCGLSAICTAKSLEEDAEDIKEKVGSIRLILTDDVVKGKNKSRSKPKEDQPASIVYTSGTTREPLGVMLSHKNLISNNKSIAKYAGLTERDKVCCVLPFYYIYGLSLLFSHLLVGATVIIDNRFMYPEVILDTIDKYKATGFAGVSSHYAILLYRSNISRRKLPTLRYFMQAGDRMSPNITKELINIFPRKKLYIMYGQTEASPRLSYLNPNLAKKKPGSIGRPIPGVEIKVVDDRGKETKTGQEGEIIVRGDNIMLGYWNNKKETANVIKARWLYTGDIALKDKDGDLFIVGRKKSFIKVGANRINPLEIEDILMKCKGVIEAAAVEADDAILGKRIKAFVSLGSGKDSSAEDIIKFCKKQLPSYKVPTEVIILPSIPKNSLGKIDKESLRSK